MTRKSCAVRMRNAILRNYLNVPQQYCETGSTVYRPYPRRLESLTICRFHYKGSTFFSVILRPSVLVRSRFELATSRTAVRCSTNWANRSAVSSNTVNTVNLRRSASPQKKLPSYRKKFHISVSPQISAPYGIDHRNDWQSRSPDSLPK